MIAGLVGGVGLFLLGMHLMTNGLKVAAGEALRTILGRWTRTPLRGLLAGAMITSLVQSSSAVTVATIGFVNAGVLTLSQAIGVVYGANIGTTMTGWLVALVGFEFDVKVAALPAIGIGMVLRTASSGTRRGALGEALAGFGIFFLGLDILRSATATLGPTLTLVGDDTHGVANLALFVGAGFLLTFLMQSSSAALAIGLTGAAGGVLSLTAGAALVIGTNLGTTTTAVLAVLGATPNARRVAAAHVVFNLVTAGVTFAILPQLLAGVVAVRTAVGAGPEPVATLALFHTAFNLLGVLLVWPMTPSLVRILEGRFGRRAEDVHRPRHLDRTALAAPALALDALALELDHVRRLARRMAHAALGADAAARVTLAADGEAVRGLAVAVGEFASEVRRGDLPADLADALPQALRASQYFVEVADLAPTIATPADTLAELGLHEALSDFASTALAIVEAAGPTPPTAEAASSALTRLGDAYESLKDRLLRDGTDGTLPIRQLVGLLERLSRSRRLVEQYLKGTRCIGDLKATMFTGTSETRMEG